MHPRRGVECLWVRPRSEVIWGRAAIAKQSGGAVKANGLRVTAR